MKTNILKSAVCAAALMTVTVPALAQDEPEGPISFSGSVVLTTNYIFRGISQTQNDPAIQGDFTIEHESGVFGTIWASNVDFDDGDEDTNLEVDFTVGFGNEVNEKFSYEVGAIYYAYPDSVNDYNYWEIYFAPSYEVPAGQRTLTFSGGIYYSPEFFLDSGDAWYLTAGAGIGLTDELSIDANVGFQNIDETTPDDYMDWNIGLTLSQWGFSFDVRYTDTDLDDADCFSFTASVNDICDGQVVFTVKRLL